jgi:copper chaperone CopZ
MNQIFEIEKKATNLKEENSIQRNINKMKGIMEEEFFKGSSTIGLTYHNPLGKDYTDTRTDCEATISGTEVENLEIVEVIKPIIFIPIKKMIKL